MTPSSDGPRDVGRPMAPPAPLTVAVFVTVAEAALLVLQGLALVTSLQSERLALGATSAGFFLLYGGFLGYCAWQVYRLRSWARSPVVLAQLIQVLVGAGFWGGDTTIVAIVAIALGLLVLAGIFHPASLAALASDRG